MTTPREIHQTFTRTPGLGAAQLRRNTQAYKRHSHARCRSARSLKGTLAASAVREYLLAPGDHRDPANAPHSCNPVQGQPRSYHMLYIDTPLPFGQQVLRDDALFGLYSTSPTKCPRRRWKRC
jgi:hypothetical protein